MKRRDLVKGLLALPFTKLMSQPTVCSNSGDCTPAPNPLLLVFEGPFAVVLQKPSSSSPNVTGVAVLVPKDPAHLFALNRVPLKDSQHHFKFVGAGLAPNTQACVDTVFKDFCVPSNDFQCDANNRFIEILNLPCPRRILARNAIQVKFQCQPNPNDFHCMPLDHVLEYHIADSSLPTTISYDEQDNRPVNAIGNVFYFEVGRDPLSSGAADHAVDFHNNHLLPCFPPLQKDTHHLLQNVFVNQPCSGSRLPNKIIKQLKPFTTTLECKSGGIIAGTP